VKTVLHARNGFHPIEIDTLFFVVLEGVILTADATYGMKATIVRWHLVHVVWIDRHDNLIFPMLSKSGLSGNRRYPQGHLS
jgi:hypothetical protein